MSKQTKPDHTKSNLGILDQRARIIKTVMSVFQTWILRKYIYSQSVDGIPVGSEIFRTRPDRPCGRPRLLYDVNRVNSRVGKAAVAWVWTPMPCSTEVTERVDPHHYSTCVPSCLVLRWLRTADWDGLVCDVQRLYTVCVSIFGLLKTIQCLCNSIMKAHQMHNFSYLCDKVFYMYRTFPLSIIVCISTLYTQQYVFIMVILLAFAIVVVRELKMVK